MADQTLTRVRETAAAYTEAVRQTQRFFDGLDDTTEPSALVEYANLVRPEESALADRVAALTDAGDHPPDPSAWVEYATRVGKKESALADRVAALPDAGLRAGIFDASDAGGVRSPATRLAG